MIFKAVFAIWQLPVAAPIWILLWLAQACGLVKRMGTQIPAHYGHEVTTFFVSGKCRIWRRLWRGWCGLALPGAIVMDIEDFLTKGGLDISALRRATYHEIVHVQQWAIFGPIFLPVYVLLLSIFGYQDHPLEVVARENERNA